ncbi:MAG: TRAM domain-containing protein, partial [Betaproteobacteria bacterium]|nr:TRAM domain-containing protein [Betaproteobacteria bacterium]
DPNELMGRTDNNRVVNFPIPGQHAQRLIGNFIDVRITRTTGHTLRGEIITDRVAQA